MKVLIIGRGAREHALGWKIRQSALLEELFFASGNAATAFLGANLDFHPMQIADLAAWAHSHKIDLTIVGPENPLMAGIREEFTRRGLLLFGPSREGARLEGSKIWAKKFLLKHGIPTAAARDFSEFAPALQYASTRTLPLVVKADGLAEGKGVMVCRDPGEAEKALRGFMIEKSVGKAGKKVLIEDFLSGEEISAFALCDGRRLFYLGEARDYKRAKDGDLGPNTGGMGAVSSDSLISETARRAIRETVFQSVLEGLLKEHILYQGVLYAGLMLTSEGPKVLEFNVRFGDPETQVLLPRIREDLLSLALKCAQGNLSGEAAGITLQSAVGVVIAAPGYPGKARKGIPLPPLSDFPKDLLVFQAFTAAENGRIVNQGGRTLTVVARGASIPEARGKVYEVLSRQPWGDYFYRKDIGLGLEKRGQVPLSGTGP